MKHLCVFCGSAAGHNPAYAGVARQLGQLLARKGHTLVYGGGHVGLMGVLADAVRHNGGKVIGVIPRGLVEKELAHPELEDLRIVENMHERKALMAELSHAFLALPGGYGTLDELFEISTWAQLKLHYKPIGLLNVNGFFDSLLQWIGHAVKEGFIREKHRGLLRVEQDAERLIEDLVRL